MQKLWGSSFFSKCSKFNLDFKNPRKNREKVFCFWYNCISYGIYKLSLLRRGYFSSVANVLSSNPTICHVNKRDLFRTQFICQGPMNLMKMLSWRFQQCLGTFTILLPKESSETLKRDFLDFHLITFSDSVISKIQNLWGSSFFSESLKFNANFKSGAENREKDFCFRDYCIWMCIVKLSLWRTRYFSSAADVLTSSTKIWHVNKRGFFQLNFLVNDQWIW